MTPSEGMPTESVTVFSGHLEQRPSLCMMWREDRVACLVNGAENWTMRPSSGLPDASLKGHRWTFTLSGKTPTASHWVDTEGRLFRSIDGGGRWQRVDVPPVVGNAVHQEPTGQRSCLSTEAGIYCTSSLGHNWSPLSNRSGQESSGVMTWSRDLYRVVGGRLSVIHRIAQRDTLPLIELKGERLIQTMRPWITEMKNDPSLRLSIRAVSPKRKSHQKRAREVDETIGRIVKALVQAGVPGVHFGVLDAAQGTEKTRWTLQLTLSRANDCPVQAIKATP